MKMKNGINEKYEEYLINRMILITRKRKLLQSLRQTNRKLKNADDWLMINVI